VGKEREVPQAYRQISAGQKKGYATSKVTCTTHNVRVVIGKDDRGDVQRWNS
jgi:hypothetical protein